MRKVQICCFLIVTTLFLSFILTDKEVVAKKYEIDEEYIVNEIKEQEIFFEAVSDIYFLLDENSRDTLLEKFITETINSTSDKKVPEINESKSTVAFINGKAKVGNDMEQYIKKYWPVCVKESKFCKSKGKILTPEVILAQAILESNYGKSILARKANNHFGIKKGKWSGEVYIIRDDDYECKVHGKKYERCCKKAILTAVPFRKYDHPEQSFRDHSLFLILNQRYEKVFHTDFEVSCKNLKKAGYATCKTYDVQLSTLIKKLIEQKKIS